MNLGLAHVTIHLTRQLLGWQTVIEGTNRCTVQGCLLYAFVRGSTKDLAL
jgi:hypothetical protein